MCTEAYWKEQLHGRQGPQWEIHIAQQVLTFGLCSTRSSALYPPETSELVPSSTSLPFGRTLLAFVLQMLPINIFGNMNRHIKYKYSIYFSNPDWRTPPLPRLRFSQSHRLRDLWWGWSFITCCFCKLRNSWAAPVDFVTWVTNALALFQNRPNYKKQNVGTWK